MKVSERTVIEVLLNDTAIAPPTPEQNCQSIVEQTVYVDLLWYEVPVVCELNRKALYYFEKPANFFDNFKVVWKKLRTIIQQTLMP